MDQNTLTSYTVRDDRRLLSVSRLCREAPIVTSRLVVELHSILEHAGNSHYAVNKQILGLMRSDPASPFRPS